MNKKLCGLFKNPGLLRISVSQNEPWGVGLSRLGSTVLLLWIFFNGFSMDKVFTGFLAVGGDSRSQRSWSIDEESSSDSKFLSTEWGCVSYYIFDVLEKF